MFRNIGAIFQTYSQNGHVTTANKSGVNKIIKIFLFLNCVKTSNMVVTSLSLFDVVIFPIVVPFIKLLIVLLR
jgi:hypothetical protein